MGFLKFLKREKKKEGFDELDLPPAPPPLEGFDEDLSLPEFPYISGEKISAPKELGQFDFPEEEKQITSLGKYEDFDMEDFPKFEEKPEQSQFQAFAAQTPKPLGMTEPVERVEQEPDLAARSIPQIYPKLETNLFDRGKKFVREMPHEKTIYVNVDNFKAMLGTLNIVRSDLKKSEESLTKLENVKNMKDKSFDKVRLSLDDLQKKLIFMDKTLFKGD